MLKTMNSHHLIGTGSRTPFQLTHGLRVHVSDASPVGFWGQVTALHRDAITVARDNGARDLVILSRRRVTVVNR